MELSEATNFFNYQRMNAKKNTLKNYEFVLTRFENYFGNIELTSITSDNILPFLTNIYLVCIILFQFEYQDPLTFIKFGI